MLSPADVWPLALILVAGVAAFVWVLAWEDEEMAQLVSYTAVGPNGRAVARWAGCTWVVEFNGSTHPVSGDRDDAIAVARELSGVAYVR